MRYNKKVKNNQVPSSFQAFLPSSPIENLDKIQDKKYVIQNLLKKANLDAWKWMLSTYTRQDISQVIVNSSQLRPKDVMFWVHYLNLSKDQVACLQTKSLTTPNPSWKY